MTRISASAIGAERRVQTREQRPQVLAFAALAPILQDDVGHAGARQRRAVVERRDAGDGDHLRDARRLAADIADLVEHLLGALERGAVGQLHQRDHVALVFDRQEAGGNAREPETGDTDEDERQEHHRHAVVDHARDQPRVAMLGRAVSPVEPAIEDVAPLRRHRGPQPHRGLGRLQGGGVDRADQRGGGNHQRELRIHAPGQTRQEGGREEHRHQHQGDADDRPEQLAHGGARRLASGHALLDIVDRALDHHDGIVHHDADRQHDREQGGEVDGETERGHGGEGADDGDRHRRCRYQHRPPVLQEHQNHDEDEDRRLVQGLVDLMNGLLHEFGGVEGNGGHEPGRKLRRERRHLLVHRAGHLERIRAGGLEDRQAGRRLSIEREDLTIGLRPELDGGDVAHPRDLPGLAGLHDHRREFGRIAELARDIERVLERLARGRGRRADLAGGDLLALLLQRLDHVLRHEPARPHLVGIEPDAHRVLAGPEHDDIADARQPGDLVLELDGREIGEIETVVALVRRGQRHDLQDRRRILLHDHALRLHRLRQRGQRARDPVLHQDLRDVEIDADLERHRQRVGAVGGAVGLHVDHALDAVHLLLDRQGDGVDDGAGAGAGITRGDLHGRGHDVGILRDR